MTYFIYYIETFLGLFIKRNKVLFVVSFLTLFLLFGWCYDHADYGIYDNRYNNYENTLDFTEPLFILFVQLCHALNLDLQGFLQFSAFLFLSSLFFFVDKLSFDRNKVIALYMLSPLFFYDVVQVRNSLSLAFVYLAFYFIISRNGDKKGMIAYVTFILLATCVHFASFVFLLYLIAFKFDIKKCIYISLSFSIASFVLSQTLLSSLMGYMVLGEKVESVTAGAAERYSGNNAILVNIAMLILMIGTFFVLYWKNRRLCDKMEDIVLKFNVLSLCLIPLLFVTVDFHRTFMAMMIFNFIIYAKWIKLTKYKMFTIGTLFVFFSLFFYRSLMVSENWERVYRSVMENNLLFESTPHISSNTVILQGITVPMGGNIYITAIILIVLSTYHIAAGSPVLIGKRR